MKNFATPVQSLTKLLFLFLCMTIAVSLSAQAKLSVQGLLKKSDGTSLADDTYEMKFNFYTEAGVFVASITESSVSVTGGVYSALLTVDNAVPANVLDFSQTYLVGLQVRNATELTPRITMSAAPYALALNGTSNRFPSFGLVKADAIDVVGAVNISGTVNAMAALNVTGTATLNGTTNTKIQYADGRIHSNNGFAYHNGGTGNSTGLFFNNSARAGIYTNSADRLLAWDDNKNYYRASAGHVFDLGDVNMVGTVTAAAFQKAANFGTYFGADNLGLRVPSSGGMNRVDILPGTTYYNSPTSHIFQINGTNVMEITAPFATNTSNDANWNQNSIVIRGLQYGPNKRNVQWDEATGRLYFDNSSRRCKSNIQPLVDDFTKILKVQPKTYDRPASPGDWEIGYIAEEIDSLGLNRLVEYSKGVPDGVDYERMAIYLTEIVKTHHTDIEKLQAEVAALTAEKNALRTENTSLRADNTALQTQQADFGKQLIELSRRLKSLETAASNR